MKKKILMTIEEDLYKEFKEILDQTGRKFSTLAQTLIRLWIDVEKEEEDMKRKQLKLQIRKLEKKNEVL